MFIEAVCLIELSLRNMMNMFAALGKPQAVISKEDLKDKIAKKTGVQNPSSGNSSSAPVYMGRGKAFPHPLDEETILEKGCGSSARQNLYKHLNMCEM